ncbi:MAG: enoyl-[acyl-carrier-protein] reductase [Candidatus Sedimenticola endophacoides]|uniref:Enoyl-[acyl-carrier-protein] reductase [NADH] n=2 Tax=Candidatus Sedimenticola endophacoides TaxID=2548426 RepID=A0A657PRB9_9GAMM|nr:MAG: enoyl-[acyl-carrier-protein] reductase [Candidatus Sedimenticola endophacoides]OQX35727.1 MAG: enoyl-[acyl-carrier-protein] reductase [Candidatus Sedimenticola endophacoides]OQX40173.1 MAG: enoyl-[acyl-carrier-protein] reductase [Candidatus Sedimenticola endophacoides]OQX40998.1 MAG: enoyl-[acyl-carrier-protein] reductase [Candidatus Sedimenticola endophacoides]OQX45914.1 MAG: enoyl-[acyl-carrier-protein] reductase [Candidatus Sedimenticola endophacoides]
MGFLQDKKVLITGIASNRSIAYGIARAMHREGAQLALTYQNEKLKKRVEKFAQEFGSDIILPLDVTNDSEIENLFAELGKRWDGLDGLVHSIAYAPADQLEGSFADAVTREGFRVAHDISAYSFAAMARAGRAMMAGRNAAMVTMTYLGAVRTVPNYNTMGVAKASLEATMRYLADSLGPDGIRVNAVSAGPIRTLAAAGIKNFKAMLEEAEQKTPLRRNVTIDEVGNATAFLCSDLASGITGDVLYVDSGYNIVGKT